MVRSKEPATSVHLADLPTPSFFALRTSYYSIYILLNTAHSKRHTIALYPAAGPNTKPELSARSPLVEPLAVIAGAPVLGGDPLCTSGEPAQPLRCSGHRHSILHFADHSELQSRC